jgi:hypothetical protein
MRRRTLKNSIHAVASLAVAVLISVATNDALAQQPNLEQMQRDLERAKREKAAREKERASTAARQATLVIRSDAPCQLSLDGRRVASLKSGEALMLTVQAGETLLECESVDGGAAKYAVTHKLEAGTKAVVQIELQAKVTAAQQSRDVARQQAERKRAEDARQAAAAAEVQSKRAAIEARFVDQGDGTLRDQQSGLTWTLADNGDGIQWNNAKTYCARKGAGWDLPSAKELLAIYDASGTVTTRCGELTCKVSSQFRLTGYEFWSRDSDGPSHAPFVVFEASGGMSLPSKGTASWVRALCVRRS